MMAEFQAEESLTGRAKKMCEKFWTLSNKDRTFLLLQASNFSNP